MRLVVLLCSLFLPAIAFPQIDSSRKNELTFNIAVPANMTVTDQYGSLVTIEVKPAPSFGAMQSAISACQTAINNAGGLLYNLSKPPADAQWSQIGNAVARTPENKWFTDQVDIGWASLKAAQDAINSIPK